MHAKTSKRKASSILISFATRKEYMASFFSSSKIINYVSRLWIIYLLYEARWTDLRLVRLPGLRWVAASDWPGPWLAVSGWRIFKGGGHWLVGAGERDDRKSASVLLGASAFRYFHTFADFKALIIFYCLNKISHCKYIWNYCKKGLFKKLS